MLTRKDYKAIARYISETKPANGMPVDWQAGCYAACERIGLLLANHFEADNPRFDRARFLKACGLKG